MTATQPSNTPLPWERIVADVADALIYADKGGTIRAWNAQAKAVFGFSPAEAIGQSLDIIIPERFQKAHWAAFDRALERGATRHGAEVRTTRANHKDERKLYVDMSFSVIRSESDEVLGAAAMARDVTERHLAEKAKKEASR
jgi:PAS domain S-box-containing protein